MNNTIHPTAILEGNVQLGSGNSIGPYAVIKGNVTLGDHNRIGAGTCIEHNVRIGNGNIVYSNVSIGALGEMGLKGDTFVEDGYVVIGDKVTVREFVCIHAPVYTRETRIHDHVYLMNKSYVAHDCVIGQGSVLSAGALLGGRVVLEEGVTIGLGATIHQRCHIGAYAMIGMQTPVTRDIFPFATIAGNPARIIGFNRRGAERQENDKVVLDGLEGYYKEGSFLEDRSNNPLILQVRYFLQEHPDALMQWKVKKG